MATTINLMDRLIATARARLPGVTEAMLNLELFNTLQEFFTDSNAWRWQSDVQLDSGTMQYPIFPPDGSDLVQILNVTYRGSPVPPQTSTGGSVNLSGRIIGSPDLSSGDTTFDPNITASPGGVFSYSIFFPTYLTLDIPPSVDAAQFPITILMALSMNDQNLQEDPSEWPLEEWMFGKFHEAWIDGLQGRLMSQINKTYSNPNVGLYHMKRFRKFIARAKQSGEKGYVYGMQNWRYSNW